MLSKVFIDVGVILASGWRPEKYDFLDEITVARVKTHLLNQSIPITHTMNIPGLRRIALLGDPGSGKTTICQYLILSYSGTILKKISQKRGINEISGLPFLITVRYFVSDRSKNPDETLVDYIAKQVSSFIGRYPPLGFVEFWLSKENSLTIFDGLDEVIRLEDRRSIRDSVMHLVEAFPNGKHLTTSRIVGYEETPLNRNKFLHLILLPLEDSQAQSFVRNWYTERELDPRKREAFTKSLVDALKEEHVGELARNPLLLTIMALVHAGEADLPKQRAKLYDKCVEAFLVNRDRARDLLSYNEDEIRVCHEFLGYWMHCEAEKTPEGSSEVTLKELRENLEKEIAEQYPCSDQPPGKKVDEFIDAAKRRVGLIVEHAAGIFAFGHRSFEEYFAARYISQNYFGVPGLWSEVEDKIGKPHWTEVLKLLAGIYGFSNRKGLTEFVERILAEDSKSKDSARSALILAGEIAGDKVPLKDIILRNITDKILEIFLNTKNERLMNRCKLVLEHLFNTPSEKYMIQKLRKVHIRLYTGAAFYGLYSSKQFGKTRIDRIVATL